MPLTLPKKKTTSLVVRQLPRVDLYRQPFLWGVMTTDFNYYRILRILQLYNNVRNSR